MSPCGPWIEYTALLHSLWVCQLYCRAICTRVWKADLVLYIGRLGDSEEMKVEDIEGALSLIDVSDVSKIAFLEKEAALEKQRSNPIHGDPASPTINTEDR